MATKPLNELLRSALPHLSLDSEIQRLVRLHGPDAVRASVRRNATKRKGRKAEQDWAKLSKFIEEDAILWLDGKDPFKLRTNYAMAKAASQKHPGQSDVSTHRRIMGKLSKQRKLMTLLAAWRAAEAGRPYGDYFRTVDALVALGQSWSADVQSLADRPRGQVQRYRETFGEPPPHLSLLDIEAALMNSKPALPPARGLLGREIQNGRSSD